MVQYLSRRRLYRKSSRTGTGLSRTSDQKSTVSTCPAPRPHHRHRMGDTTRHQDNTRVVEPERWMKSYVEKTPTICSIGQGRRGGGRGRVTTWGYLPHCTPLTTGSCFAPVSTGRQLVSWATHRVPSWILFFTLFCKVSQPPDRSWFFLLLASVSTDHDQNTSTQAMCQGSPLLLLRRCLNISGSL